MGFYYENCNVITGHELNKKFDEELEKLAQLDGRDISTELEWLVGREMLRRELEQCCIDREVRNLQRELAESNQRGSIQLAISEEMENIRKSIDGSIREQQEGIKNVGKLGR